jgi:molybdenum cofactor guanylyltransferase
VAEAVRGYVLAGGLSTRMGRDKALVNYHGTPLLVRMLERMARVVAQPKIVGTRSDLLPYAPVVPDLHSAIGPLGGLEAALQDSDAELNLFLPVDLPQLPVFLLSTLLERAQVTGALATVPLMNGMPQPLVTVYRRAMLPLIQEAIGCKEYKVMGPVYKARNLPDGVDFFHVEALLWGESEWPYLWFRNVNSPEDLL